MLIDKLIFRPATLADLPAIIALLADDVLGRTREVVSEPVDPAYVAAFEAISRDPNQRQIVVVEAGEIIGTLQLSFVPGLTMRGSWRGQIEGVRVASSRRGTGVGTRMFEWAIEQCRSRHCRLVQLMTDNTRVDAHRFYERLGFRNSHVGMKLELKL